MRKIILLSLCLSLVAPAPAVMQYHPPATVAAAEAGGLSPLAFATVAVLSVGAVLFFGHRYFKAHTSVKSEWEGKI